MKTIVLQLDPKPKPVITDKTKHSEKAQRYYAYKDELRAEGQLRGYEFPPDGRLENITFVMPLPLRTSKKKIKELTGTPHQIKPDLDNMLKAFQDAFTLTTTGDDSFVYRYNNIEKVWGEYGCIIINIP